MNGDSRHMSNKRRNSDCCTKNRLCGLSMFLTVCLIIALVFLAVVSYFLFIYSKKHEFCTEPQCIRSSAEISEFVDDDVDPCDDFHAFVCDKFMKTAYEKQLSTPLKAEQERVENKINNFIIEPESEEDLQPVLMQKKYFRACLDEERMDNNNNTGFLKLLKEIGGWPIVERERWRYRDFNWMEAMVRSRQLGLPFDWFLDIDVDDSQTHYLKISKPKNCDRLEESSSEKYVDMIAHITESLIGPNIEVMEKIYEIVNFEKRLAQICAKVKNEVLIKSTIKNLNRTWPLTMGPRKFIRDITGPVTNWDVFSEVVYNRDYIIKLNSLLNNTTEEVQANYIGWKITEYFAPYLSKPIRERYKNYIEQLSEEDIDRFQFCLADTKSKFNLVSETMYIRENVDEEIQAAAELLVESIKSELLDQIQNFDWMDDATKEKYLRAYEKAKTIIGGSDSLFEDDFFTKYLHIGQLSFSSPSIINMLCDWSRTAFFAKMRTIGRPRMEELPNSQYILNTTIDVHLTLNQHNQILIFLPASVFHSTIYDIDRPQYLNYAGLGTLIAIKLFQNMVNLTNEVNDNYYESLQKQRQCVVGNLKGSINEQVAPYVVLSNFHDLLGRHLAYNAYQKFVEENGEEPLLPGMSYSPNELFWIKSSMNWCYQALPDEETPSLREEMLKHSVTETVKNSPSFGQDFNCEEGSLMNPPKKCNIL